ncbi:MAG TPA: hypothetical protein VGK72_00250 [Chthoniobacterales bacterium]
MRQLFITLAGALVLVANARGAIGESEGQIRARYGEAVQVLPAHAADSSLTKCYFSNGFLIFVSYIKNHSVRETLTKANNTKLTVADVQDALRANGGNSAWTTTAPLTGSKAAGVQVWRTSDAESRVAIYDAQTHALFITTQRFIDRTRAMPPLAAGGTASAFAGARGTGRTGGAGAPGGHAMRSMKLLDKNAFSNLRQAQPQPSASPGK